MDHVILDTLHLFLRISDVLIDLLIRELRRSDAIEKKTTFSDGFPRDKYKHMASYEEFVKSISQKFLELIGDLKLDFTSEDDILQLQGDIKLWFELFLNVYQAKDVTPYMNALHCQVPEFLSLYQNIAYYTQQGLEKYNDRASSYLQITKELMD